MLSIMDHYPYSEETVHLQPGDILLIYSDGVPEAMNATKQQFGEERLRDLLLQSRDRPVGELIDTIIAAVKVHAGSYPQSDDITLIAVKRNPL